MCCIYFISFSFQFCNGNFLLSLFIQLIQLIKHTFLFNFLSLLIYMSVWIYLLSHSLWLFENLYSLRSRGNGLFLNFLTISSILYYCVSELPGKEQTGSTGVWRNIRKERTKAIWENSLTLFPTSIMSEV